MIRQRFRTIALGVVFTVGIASIMATSRIESSVHFEDTNIRPAWRCPGTDVKIDWRLNEPGPVSVTADGREYRLNAETKNLTVAADIFDRTDAPVEIALQVELADAGYPDKYEIRTLRQESLVSEGAYRTEDAGFTMNQGSGLWDRHIGITGFEITNVRNFVCVGEAKYPQSWEVTTPSGWTFELRASDGFERRLDPGIAAGGIWKLRPAGADCKPVQSGLRPEINIRLTAVCRRPENSS